MMYVRVNHMFRSRKRKRSSCFGCFGSGTHEHTAIHTASDDENDDSSNEGFALQTIEAGRGGFGAINRQRFPPTQRQPDQCPPDPPGYRPMPQGFFSEYRQPSQELNQPLTQWSSNQNQSQSQPHPAPLPSHVIPVIPPPPFNSEEENLEYQRAQRAFGKQSAAYASLQVQQQLLAPPP